MVGSSDTEGEHVDVWDYVDNQPDPPDVPEGWTGAYAKPNGSSSTAAGEAWYSGGGYLTRTWISLEHGVGVGYSVTPRHDEVVVSKLIDVSGVGDDPVYDADGDLLATVQVEEEYDSIREYDKAAMNIAVSLVGRVEAGEFENSGRK
jgi:hypothetical protein